MKQLIYTVVAFSLFSLSLLAQDDTPLSSTDTNDHAGVVYVIPIEGMIEPALLYVIRRGVAEAEKNDADAIIFTMETPGGTVKAAEDIIKTISNITVPTYTFVDKNAISAGAIIALATDHIYMAPGSKIGDAMPIMVSPFGAPQEMPEAIEEKTVSYVAGLIRTTAQQSGHNDELAEAMVRRGMEFKIGDEVISSEGQLLTLTNIEAEKKYGDPPEPLLSEGTVDNLDQLLDMIGLSSDNVITMNVTPAERIARFIAALSPLFLIGGLIGLYIEFKTPGFGLPGIAGIICLGIFFWGHHIAGLAGMEDILIFAIGILLLLIEIFIIPGFGVVGITGICLILWSLLNAMIEHFPGDPWYPTIPQLKIPVLKLFISLIGTVIIGYFIGRYLPSIPGLNRLILKDATRREEGYLASSETSELIGQTGKCITALRPAGIAIINGRKIDVVSDGDFMDKGTMIRIIESHGSRIVVEKA